MLNAFKHISIGLIILFMANQSFGQEKAVRATKKIEKSFRSTNLRVLSIIGEKADIDISHSKDDNYYIQIEIISQHTDATIAQEQLNFMKHLISNKNKTIYLRNYLLVDQGKSINGTLKAKYKVQIPQSTKLEIKNSLGNIHISNIKGDISIDARYGQIHLHNTLGELKINCSVGDIFLNACSTMAKIEMYYMNAYLNNNRGSFNITANMGTCTFSLNEHISLLKIEANGTNIILNNKQDHYFGYYIKSELGKINIDESCIPIKSNIRIDERFKENKETRFEYRKASEPCNIIISNKYNNISIQ